MESNYILDLPFLTVGQRLRIRTGLCSGDVIGYQQEARTWLDVFTVVATITFRLEVFVTADGKVFLE